MNMNKNPSYSIPFFIPGCVDGQHEERAPAEATKMDEHMHEESLSNCQLEEAMDIATPVV